MIFNLINDKLVVKMKKTSKIALAITAVGFIILVILISTLNNKVSFLGEYAFIIVAGYFVICLVSYMIWLVSTSRMDFKTITFDLTKFYLDGRAGHVEVKYEGLAMVEIDEQYSPDLYVSFIYNEENTYKFMIHKNSWPEFKKVLEEHRFNYQYIKH